MRIKDTHIVGVPDARGRLHLAKVYKVIGESPNLATATPVKYVLDDSSQTKIMEVITEEKFNLLSANPLL